METSVVSRNENTAGEKRTQQKIEFAIRFFTLGVGGFLIFTFCSLALIVELSYGEPMLMNPSAFPWFLAMYLCGVTICAATRAKC